MPRLASRRPWLISLILVTGVGPLATDTYISSLPEVRATLGTTSTVAQLTLTFFIAGMAIGQLLSGPVSDSRGRRGLILASSSMFTLMSLLCAMAPTGPALVVERAVQGLVAGTGVAVGRAVVTDRYVGARAAAAYGTLTSASLIGPVVAPAVGGALLTVGDWRTIFLFLGGVGVLMTSLAFLGIPETLPVERRQASGLREVAGRMRDLLTDRAFVAPVVVQCLVVAGFFVYIGGSSIVLQTQVGITQQQYTLLFATNALVMVAASVAFRLLVVRTGAVLLRRVAMAVATVAASVLFAACLLAPGARAAAPARLGAAGGDARRAGHVPAGQHLDHAGRRPPLRGHRGCPRRRHPVPQRRPDHPAHRPAGQPDGAHHGELHGRVLRAGRRRRVALPAPDAGRPPRPRRRDRPGARPDPGALTVVRRRRE